MSTAHQKNSADSYCQVTVHSPSHALAAWLRTNMIQPFWALPALGIAGLSARDIMGYCIITLLFSGIVVCGGFLIVGLI